MPNTQAVGVAYSDPEFTTCYASGALGYSAAAQTAVTQATSKSTGVTANTSAGQITMNGAALGATTNVTFTLTNSTLSANDVVIVNVASANATAGIVGVCVDNDTLPVYYEVRITDGSIFFFDVCNVSVLRS